MSRFGRRSFSKSPCRFCGRIISGNMMNYHQTKCQPAMEHAREEELRKWTEKPVERLTIRQAQETGRMAEFIDALNNGGGRL